jgi:hypothetical protein
MFILCVWCTMLFAKLYPKQICVITAERYKYDVFAIFFLHGSSWTIYPFLWLRPQYGPYPSNYWKAKNKSSNVSEYEEKSVTLIYDNYENASGKTLGTSGNSTFFSETIEENRDKAAICSNGMKPSKWCHQCCAGT